MVKEKKNNLIVDCAWYTTRYPNSYLVKIGDEYFVKHYRENRLRKVNKQWACNTNKSEFPDYMYITAGLEKKSGYNVRLGRAITTEEMDELKKRFSLDEDSISEPFEEVKGDFFGEKYRKVYTAIQIKLRGSLAIGLERELNKEGIEAGSYAPGILSIRIG